jgi:hypothetical protein
MGYLLPRAIIVLIAWAVTGLVVHVYTTVDPALFCIAGVVWTMVGLACFNYLDGLRDQTPQPSLRRAAPSVLKSGAVPVQAPARFQPRMRSP